MDFNGKSVIITGAAVGIGRGTAQLFAEKHADLSLIDLDIDGLEVLAEELRREYGVRVLTFGADISDEGAVKEIVRKAAEAYGEIDVLVNNAGLWRSFAAFAESDSTQWKRYIDVNILGTMYFSHAVLQYMLPAGYGRIVNVGSVAGVYGNANMAAYSMTKGAVIAFTKALAKEVCDRGILVNCVSPGSVAANEDDKDTPLCYMGRTGTPRENAKLIAFLASDDATYISGQNIQIDGCRKKV